MCCTTVKGLSSVSQRSRGWMEELRDVEIFCHSWHIPFPGPDLEPCWQVGGGITSLSLSLSLSLSTTTQFSQQLAACSGV